MIYLDNNATTKIDQRVFHKQCEVLNKFYGNPSSLYPMGTEIKNMVFKARKQVAALINADLDSGDKVIFTSCATESNNTVLHSVLGSSICGKHIIISSVEHPSIMNTASYYESLGCKVSRIRVDKDGIVDEKQLIASINPDTVLVSVMLVNSETGVIQNIEKLTNKIKSVRSGILVHTDAVQAAGKISIDVKKLGIDFLTLSGHKFHAPKGVGALYIKRDVPFVPLLYGGHQESGFRPGTENTASIVAMGVAAEIAKKRLNAGETERIEKVRDELEKILEKEFDVYIAGKYAPRVGNTSNVGFRNVDGNKLVLLLALKDICVSSGTACNSVSAEPSSVLKAMGVPEEYIKSIRISLSADTTDDDIEQLISNLKDIIKK